MSEEAPAPGVGETVVSHVAGGEGPLTLHEAARSATDWRRKLQSGAADPPEKETTQEASAETATPATESEAAEAAEDAAPVEEQATGETQDGDPAAEPPLDRPRSWSKEKETIWTKLDRETQQYLLDHDSEVSKGVRNAQNEAAEKLKGLTAKEQAAEQARQQYEQASVNTLNVLYELQNSQFPEIKSFADAQKLSVEDPMRYVQWRSNQDLVEAKQREVAVAQQQRQQEFTQQWSDYASKQDQLLNERAPELADETTARKWTKAAQDVLQEIGFKPEELAQAWDGKASLSLRDHRTQLLVLKAAKYDESLKQQKTAKENVAKKPLPPVQRPGAAKPANAGAAAEVKNLQAQLHKSSGLAAVRIATQLASAQRRASQ